MAQVAKAVSSTPHPGAELRANLESISHRCHLEAPLRGGICMGFDQRNRSFAPGLPPGRLDKKTTVIDVRFHAGVSLRKAGREPVSRAGVPRARHAHQPFENVPCQLLGRSYRSKVDIEHSGTLSNNNAGVPMREASREPVSREGLPRARDAHQPRRGRPQGRRARGSGYAKDREYSMSTFEGFV